MDAAPCLLRHQNATRPALAARYPKQGWTPGAVPAGRGVAKRRISATFTLNY
jgi:hypothetical protein